MQSTRRKPSVHPNTSTGVFILLPKRPLAAARRGAKLLIRPITPLLAQRVVTRRCNLSCGYCSEYDEHSSPVRTGELFARVDQLAALGTLVLTLTGGEPLLHPELDRVVARAVERGMVVTTVSNAYPFTKRWFDRLNRAGLTLVQSRSTIRFFLAMTPRHAKPRPMGAGNGRSRPFLHYPCTGALFDRRSNRSRVGAPVPSEQPAEGRGRSFRGEVFEYRQVHR
ncbi:MAG: radical SAM protein [Myxococcota bacterium]